MVVSDFNIICLNQQKKKIFNIPGLRTVAVMTSNINNLYGDKWSFLSSLSGFMYNIFPIDNKKEYDYTRGLFDLEIRCNTKFMIPEYDSLKNIIYFIDKYIELSPINMICVLNRLDWGTENTITGTVGRDLFLKKLQSNQLAFNTAYIVGK